MLRVDLTMCTYNVYFSEFLENSDQFNITVVAKSRGLSQIMQQLLNHFLGLANKN